VTNADLTVSNPLTFMLWTPEFARGYDRPDHSAGRAHAIALTPSGDYAYIAGVGGAHAVVINPALPAYLSSTPIPYASELVDIATTAQGTRTYAVSTASGELVEINTDPTTGLLFNTVLASRDLGAGPKGIVTNPTGQRAFVATDAGEIQVWDIQLGSANYNEQVGAMPSPAGTSPVGPMAITPAGDRLLAVTDTGDLLHDLDAETLLTDPRWERIRAVWWWIRWASAYVTHDNGEVTVVNVEGNFVVQDVAIGGGCAGCCDAGGLNIYATTASSTTQDHRPRRASAAFRTVVGLTPRRAILST
jgi:DNA-binding beta-propeller fold protein YncE